MSIKKEKGFSIIELMVVIAIVAILTSAGLLYTKSKREDAKIAGALQFRNSLNNVLGAYIVGSWKFEGSNGEEGYDDSGYENDCSLKGSGGTALYVSSVHNSLGQALRIKNRWLDCGTSDNRPNLFSPIITMEAWAKANSLSNNKRGIVTNKYSDNYGINLYMSNNNIGARIGNGTTFKDITTDWKPSIGDWYHIAVTYNPKNQKAILYVNGKIEKELSSGVLSYRSGTNFFAIGCNLKSNAGNCSNNGLFDGDIDEVKIYNESLIFAQIKKNYAQGLKRLGFSQ